MPKRHKTRWVVLRIFAKPAKAGHGPAARTTFLAYFIFEGNLIKRPATMKTPRPQW
jgi:hypothetical protein